MSLSSFCDGYDEATCASCPKHETQHPCWHAKATYWKKNGMVISDRALPSRTRSHAEPSHVRNPQVSYDHAIPTDDRGVPYLGASLEPLTQKEINDLGSKFDEKQRELANGIPFSNTVNAR